MTLNEAATNLGTDVDAVQLLMRRGTLPRVDEQCLCCGGKAALAVDVDSIREVMSKKLGASRVAEGAALCKVCEQNPKLKQFGRPKAVEAPGILTSTAPRFLEWAKGRGLAVVVDHRYFVTERGWKLRAYLLETRP